MARDLSGTSSILAGARLICRMVRRFGTAGLAARTSADFATAVVALEVACAALEAADDWVGQVDFTAGFGPEDEEPVEGS